MEASPSPAEGGVGRGNPGRRRTAPWLLLPLLSVVAFAAAARYLGLAGLRSDDSFATVVRSEAAAELGGRGGRDATSSRLPPPLGAGGSKYGGGEEPGGPLSAGRCRALRSHEGGRWIHVTYDGNATSDGGGGNATASSLGASSADASELDAAAVGREYYPAEVDWLRGVGRPARFDKMLGCKAQQWQGPAREGGLMYLSLLGNQCGCGTDAFEPSHSAWTTGPGRDAARKQRRLSSWAADGAVRLVRALAGRTMCLVGDSIDLQFYHAAGHGLRRAAALRGLNITVDVGRDAVNYTEETGQSYYGKGFRYLDAVERTDVVIDGGLHRATASIRYVKFYGWAPMHLSFTDGCDVVVTNLGLHYDEATGRMNNANRNQLRNTLDTDVPALMGWMLDHSSRRPGNAAVWRSALPQHFDTRDGHYRAESRKCVPMPKGHFGGRAVQAYNRRYEGLFARMCNASTVPGDGTARSECAPYEMTCTARRTDPGTSSLHRYYVDSGCCTARRERLEGLPDEVTGRVLRWDVADLFDVPSWHVDNADCSHFCYVPSLYGEAFGRLAVLLGGG